MRDMLNVAFQNAWFGPYMIPNVYVGNGPEELPAGPVYNDGPMDGLKEASMHAQWFAQIPVVSAYQARLAGGLVPPCPVGQMALNDRGTVRCVKADPASAMIAAQGVVNSVPQRTFPVSPFYGFQIG